MGRAKIPTRRKNFKKEGKTKFKTDCHTLPLPVYSPGFYQSDDGLGLWIAGCVSPFLLFCHRSPERGGERVPAARFPPPGRLIIPGKGMVKCLRWVYNSCGYRLRVYTKPRRRVLGTNSRLTVVNQACSLVRGRQGYSSGFLRICPHPA